MKQLFTLFLCLTCLISCDETAYPLEPHEGGFMPGGIPIAVEKSLKNSNEIVDQQIETLLEQMKNTANDKPHLKPILVLAKSISKQAQDLEQNIQNLRVKISNPKGLQLYNGSVKGKSLNMRRQAYEAQGFKNFVMVEDNYFDGLPVNISDKTIINQIFIKEEQGETLKKTLQSTRFRMLEVIKEFIKNEGNNIPGVQFYEADLNQLDLQLTLNKIPDHEEDEWSKQVFGRLNLANTYTLLRQYEHNTKNAVLQLLNYLSQNMGSRAVIYDKFDIFASAPKSAIFLGESYEAEIALGAFSSQADFNVKVNGAELEVVGGKAQYKTTPNSVGTKIYRANISIRNPLTDETETVSKEFLFEVLPR